MSETTVYLLRHAQSLPSSDVLESLWPLSSSGSTQAIDLVIPLSELGIGKIFSSPFKRTLDTVTPFSRAANLRVEIENDLRERKLKEEAVIDNWEVIIEKAWHDFTYALPNCESGYSCQNRVEKCISGLVEENYGDTFLVSSHGNAIGLYLNKLDADFGYSQWKAMRNPDLFKIIFTGDSPRWDKKNQLLGKPAS